MNDCTTLNGIDLLPREARSEAANAKRFAAQFGGLIRWDMHGQKWLVWDDKRWVHDACKVEAFAKQFANSLWPSVRRLVGTIDEKTLNSIIAFVRSTNGATGIRNFLSLARSEPGIAVQRDQLDADPWLVTVENGTIDLRSGQLREHRKDELITKLAPVVYDPAAKCPQWLAFLDRIFAGSHAWISFMQRWCGYLLTGSTREQKLCIAHGCGANGKTTCVEAIISTYGDYAGKAPPKLLAMRKNEPHPTEVAYLFGQRAVFITETDENGRLDETLVKHLTGSDTLNARRLYENPWTFRPSHKLTISTNHRPEIKNGDEAIWRRVIYVPFSVVIPEAEWDRQLADKLRSESAGIMAWCVAGCLAWQRDGLALPQEAVQAVKEYRAGEDLFSGFIESQCERAPEERVSATKLLDAYRRFSGDELSAKKLSTLLRDKGFASKRTASGMQWLGLRLNEA